jgi:hypothetical protein
MHIFAKYDTKQTSNITHTSREKNGIRNWKMEGRRVEFAREKNSSELNGVSGKKMLGGSLSGRYDGFSGRLYIYI